MFDILVILKVKYVVIFQLFAILVNASLILCGNNKSGDIFYTLILNSFRAILYLVYAYALLYPSEIPTEYIGIYSVEYFYAIPILCIEGINGIREIVIIIINYIKSLLKKD